jgi:uncharacterized protein (TIGR03000 family)
VGQFSSASFARPVYAATLNPTAVVTANATVRMRVSLPTADAQLWIQDQLTQQRGLERVFESPNLEPGKSYTYSLRASWMENGKEVVRKLDIDVRSGQVTPVQFTAEPQVADKAEPAKVSQAR